MITSIQLFDDYKELYPNLTFGEEYTDFEYSNALTDMIDDFVDALQNMEVITSNQLIEVLDVVREFYHVLTGADILVNVQDLLIKKTQDYNSDKIDDPSFRIDDPRFNYFPFGHYSYVHMILTKVQRIESLVNSGKENNFEGKNDSLIDVAAYLSFYYSFLLLEEDRFDESE